VKLSLARRQICAAPKRPARTGVVCHCLTVVHAVTDRDRACLEADIECAEARGNTDLVGYLKRCLEACPTQGPAVNR
jgi:hypothetical protein